MDESVGGKRQDPRSLVFSSCVNERGPRLLGWHRVHQNQGRRGPERKGIRTGHSSTGESVWMILSPLCGTVRRIGVSSPKVRPVTNLSPWSLNRTTKLMDHSLIQNNPHTLASTTTFNVLYFRGEGVRNRMESRTYSFSPQDRTQTEDCQPLPSTGPESSQ